MFNKSILLLLLLGQISCGGGSGNSNSNANTGGPIDSPVGADEQPVISSFTFLKANNPVLESDITLSIKDQNITGRVVSNSPVDSLVATVEHEG